MSFLTTRRGWVGLAIAPAAIAAVLILATSGGPSVDRARRAYDRGDWATAASDAAGVLERDPANEAATRLRARALAAQGRPFESVALDAKLGGGRLEAEDLFLLGRALLKAGRPTLGWAALDAASKLDPRHPGVAEALAGRSRQAEQLAKSDRLSAVPGGPALAELVVGLAGLGDRDDPANRLVDAALRRDRPTLAKLGSPADARKLLARLLLEEGRAREARDQIGPSDDPESRWLLGRAYLVEGDLTRAKEATARAGSFGLDHPILPEPARYLGAKACAACHQEIYQGQQNSHHSATIARGDGLKAVPLPDGPVVDPENPAVTHRFRREGSRIEQTSKVGDREVRAVIDYALGSGHHGVTMLAREEDGRHRSLRMSYYSGGKHWGLTSGFEPTPDTPAGYIGELLNDESFQNCLNCHSTRFNGEADRRGPEVADRGIGCERCHGPGDHHVRAVEAGFAQPAIARPRLATPAARLKLCAQCHASDGVIPPADPRFIRFQGTTLPYSRCVTESAGKLDCVACHDPHRDVETDPAYYEARCLACHDPGRRPKAPTPELRVEAVAAGPCPVDASKGCIGCHMPKVDNIMPFMSFTDHHIRVHRPGPGAGPARNHR